MKTKLLFSIIVAGSVLLNCAVFGQTAQMTGKVLAVSSSVITLQKDAEVWDIKRTQTTTVSGALKVGSTVTVTYALPDAQKKEGPSTATSPTPTPASM